MELTAKVCTKGTKSYYSSTLSVEQQERHKCHSRWLCLQRKLLQNCCQLIFQEPSDKVVKACLSVISRKAIWLRDYAGFSIFMCIVIVWINIPCFQRRGGNHRTQAAVPWTTRNNSFDHVVEMSQYKFTSWSSLSLLHCVSPVQPPCENCHILTQAWHALNLLRVKRLRVRNLYPFVAHKASV